MKTHGSLFEEICSFANLHAAWKRAAAGKRENDSVGRFATHLEGQLFRLREELLARTYRPGAYRETITEPKARARRRLRWNVRQHLRGELTGEELSTRWRSWKGHALQADAAGIIENIRRTLVHDLGTAGQ